MNLKYPILRNQAIRIDFAEEPQYLQGIHQDVRGMRSANCLNFWIALREVNESKGTLSVFQEVIGTVRAYQIFNRVIFYHDPQVLKYCFTLTPQLAMKHDYLPIPQREAMISLSRQSNS
ncbi:MAG: hypothetical protein K1X70_17975 [Leptospirales bacterium]|nr:hypothetical protein [Leptospirales bacterium]HNJ05307.1 hypothetical protein [Leptospiraceae bacterium]HNL02659.1 hypothetical protein [Leptospiraceae bacterium]HNL70467.1 hypothetical protein [Leptospiraceae bacterium]HNN75389.1 hypothetical protein [Leptospiraceae bacterium]